MADYRHLDEPWADDDLAECSTGAIEKCADCGEFDLAVYLYDFNGRVLCADCLDRADAEEQIRFAEDADAVE